MLNHWLIRIGDGKNFKNSSEKNIWGIKSKVCSCKKFKPGDILWFVKSNSGGKIEAIAEYNSHKKRDFNKTLYETQYNKFINQCNGWTNGDLEWDIDINYSNLYWLNDSNLLTNIKGSATFRKYNPNKCKLDLNKEYNNIINGVYTDWVIY